ncbi:carbohydrate ABC transporter permease [Fundicoccus culcitae]|uniref:Carbohydrate ABC transporter permease n=2 Tax=Fundicoccus culcitae TaxID=2969821 RepID=A0ABY5P9P1_9LACT|nr:carbohydrate ABC transporter permease [Fundicoccus culcitae]UUX35482.1 carbohydrate ABC transporter permease [Fundicoccus culcitae]
MMTKKRIDISKYLAYFFLIILALIWLFPAVFGLLTSFKSQGDIMNVGFRMLPANWVMQNYVKLLQNGSSAPIVTWFFNSLFVSTTHSLLVVLIVSLTAFGYTRINFKGRDFLFYSILAISMFPSAVNIIPSYKIVDSFGWTNNFLVLIVPGLGGVSNVFLVRQFMQGIPLEYDESAKMDGATDFTIYSKIIIPLVKPILIVTGMFSFVGSWNDFLWPTIVMNNVKMLTITAGLQLLQDLYGNYVMIGQLMAAAVIAMIPTVLLFVFAQKYFIDSLNLNVGLK